MIAITLVAGAAVFGFISGQAVQSVAAVGSTTNEKGSVIFVQITSGTPGSAAVYVYNYGPVTSPSNPKCIGACLVVEAINVFAAYPSTLGTVSCVPGTPSWAPGTISATIAQYSVKSFALSCSSGFTSGTAYTFVVVGKYGSSAQMTAVAP